MNSLIKRLKGYFCSLKLKTCGKNLLLGKSVVLDMKKNIAFGENVYIGDFVEVNVSVNNYVRMGNNIVIGRYSRIKCTGSYKDSVPGIIIGDNFSCGDFCFFGSAGSIVIGNNVMLAQNVRFHAQNHIFESTELPIRDQGTTQIGIVVEDDCWISSGVVILDGVKIGKGSVLGACSVITKDVDPYSVVVGNPGRMIRNRLQKSIIKCH